MSSSAVACQKSQDEGEEKIQRGQTHKKNDEDSCWISLSRSTRGVFSDKSVMFYIGASQPAACLHQAPIFVVAAWPFHSEKLYELYKFNICKAKNILYIIY